MIDTGMSLALRSGTSTSGGTRPATTDAPGGDATSTSDAFQSGAAGEADDLASFLQQSSFSNTLNLYSSHYATGPRWQPSAWTDEKPSVTPSSLADALEAASHDNPGRKVDLVGLESCLMSPILESLAGTADESGYLFAGDGKK